MYSNDLYRFRLMLDGKDLTTHSVNSPEEYLSPKAIERRIKHHVPIDEVDFPVSQAYLSAIRARGMKVITQSKWMNSVVIECSDSLAGIGLCDLPFVKSAQFVWKQPAQSLENIVIKNPSWQEIVYPLRSSGESENYYGHASLQIKMLHGERLHQAGYRGEGMTIAVLDAGFRNSSAHAVLSGARIAGSHDFVSPGNDVFADNLSEHGARVFSIMSANLPETMVGTAPDATFWLLRSEDTANEFPIEEDYWAAAIEFADSVGADIINSSLGYYVYDSPAESYRTDQLDGQTAFITQTANIGAAKGLLICNSSGNEGNGKWRYICFPSDAANVLTVGGVDKNGQIAAFSSVGPTSDNRIKPDIMALGSSVAVMDNSGNPVAGNGTSYAVPIISGLMACLWQAFPELSNVELIELLRQHASKSDSPDNNYGYGIPNLFDAYSKALTYTQQLPVAEKGSVRINYTDNLLFISNLNTCNDSKKLISIVSSQGQLLTKATVAERLEIDLQHYSNGFYIISITDENSWYSCKFVK
jgi:hypothetical protein